VIDAPEINAYATPGGFVYVNRGLIAYLNSEEQLAGVIGHEIAHVTARHHARRKTAGVTNQVLGHDGLRDHRLQCASTRHRRCTARS
jgi:predicted Zn-dependent protease